VHVDSDGKFFIVERGQRGRIATGDSMKQALRAARMEFRKEQIRVAVPFTMLMPDGQMYSAISRGFHARDQYKMLIWIDDGSKEGKNEQIQSYGYGRNSSYLIPEIPEKDVARVKKLLERRVKLRELTTQCDRLIEEWQQAHTFDLRAATLRALEEAAESDSQADDQSPVSTPEDQEVDELLGLEEE
jgi:hypothetical protein